ncbi:MAG: tetratricopeptide repeat protein [Candidatus Puniceispirillaceae bacterium]
MEVSQKSLTKSTKTNFMMVMMLAICALFISVSASLAAGTSYSNDNAGDSGANKLAKVRVALAQNDYDTALNLLKPVLAADNTNADAWNFRGFALRKLQRYDEAQIAYERALAENPRHKGAMEYMGELFLTLDQPDRAKELLARLEKACYFTCPEKKQLSAAIAAYEAR